MEWILILVLFAVCIWLATLVASLWSWAKEASKWMDRHYKRHLTYHDDWRTYPGGDGEGTPPTFPGGS